MSFGALQEIGEPLMRPALGSLRSLEDRDPGDMVVVVVGWDDDVDALDPRLGAKCVECVSQDPGTVGVEGVAVPPSLCVVTVVQGEG